MGQHYSRFKYLKNPNKVGLTEETFYKSETWSILNREHVKTILENQKYYLPVFKNVRVPEEHFNVSITLLKHGKDSFIDRRTTFVDWPEGSSPHPTTFGPKLSSSDKKLIKDSRKISFFARKFTKEIDAKDNNIIKFILELIK